MRINTRNTSSWLSDASLIISRYGPIYSVSELSKLKIEMVASVKK